MATAFLTGLYYGFALVACWFLLFHVIIDRSEHGIGQKISEFVGFIVVFMAPAWLLILLAGVAAIAHAVCRVRESPINA